MANDCKDDSKDARATPVDRSDPDYKIGYKKPPRGRPFEPGRSGNPKGRPKGHKNLGTLIDEELQITVGITEHGKRKTISKSHAVAKQLVNKAAGGDPKSILTLVNRDAARGARTDATAPPEFNLTDADTQVLKEALARLRRVNPPPDCGATSTEPQIKEEKNVDSQS